MYDLIKDMQNNLDIDVKEELELKDEPEKKIHAWFMYKTLNILFNPLNGVPPIEKAPNI